jgi:hypothetical protein
VRITRTRVVKGSLTRETAHLVVSLPAEHAQPVDLQDWARREWHIENRLHWVRDMTFRGDAHQVSAPATDPLWQRYCATPRSAFTAPTANPTSPAPPVGPTVDQTTLSTP